MARYLHAFEALERANRKLTPQLQELFSDPVDANLVASIVKDPDLLMALRYLAAPPVSADDLKTLSGERLAWTQIRDDPAQATAIRDVLASALDPKRYPWIGEGRPPAETELDKAILAASVVASAQRVQTARRSDERVELQGALEKLLATLSFTRADKPRGGIKNLVAHAPKPGTYIAEVLVGEHNADVVVGLHDFRILAIECKGSNSEINSRKRINKEVAQDARDWVERFGSDNLVPAAFIQGVFNPRYIEQAQETPVVFFWAHRLADVAEFLEGCRSA